MFSLFLIIGIIGSSIPILFICDSFINNIPNYDYFEYNWLNYGNTKSIYDIYYYKYYNNLKIIHKEYEKLSDKRNLSSVDIIIHFVILPTFILLSFIFSNCFICCKREKNSYILFEIISILLKGLCISDKILYEIKRSNMSILDNKKESNSKIIEIYKDYENYRQKGIFENKSLLISIIFLGLECIIFLILLCINCSEVKNNLENNDNDIDEKRCGRKFIVFYTVFSFLSVPIYIMGNFACSKCKLKYEKYYEKNRIYNYYYKSYPILKEIIDIYNSNNNYDKYSIKEFKMEYFNNKFFYFFSILILFTIITYILAICFNTKQKCKKGFIVFQIFSIIIKGIIIFFTIKYTLKGLKKNLEKKEYKKVQFLIDDYYNYYQCKIKYTIMVIIQIVYVLIEIINMISSLVYFKKINNEIFINIINNIRENENVRNNPVQNENNNIQQHNNNHNDRGNNIIRNRNNGNNIQEVEIVQINNRIEIQPNKPKPIIVEKKIEKINLNFTVDIFSKAKYNLEAYTNERFTDVLTKLLNKYEFFIDNTIKYIFTQKIMIYSDELNEENKFKTIEDFNIQNNEIIIIHLEETDKNKIKRDKIINQLYPIKKEENKKNEGNNNNINNDINGRASIISNSVNIYNFFPFLIFVNTVNDVKYFTNIILTDKFGDVFNKLKEQNSDINNYDFQEIFLSGKKEKFSNINNKTIAELALKQGEYVYLYGKIIKNVMIDLHFYWEIKDKQYELQIGKKQQFHDAVIKLISKEKELQKYIITQLYYIPSIKNENEKTMFEIKTEVLKRNEKENLFDIDKGTNFSNRSEILTLFKKPNNSINKMLSTENKKPSEKIVLETESLKCYEIIENLNINEENIIYLEAKEDLQKIEYEKNQEEKKKFLEYSINPNNNGDKKLINFKLTTGLSYNLFIDKKTTILESIEILRKSYKSLEKADIKKILYNAQPLDNNGTIEKYNIESNSPVLMFVQ